MSPRGLVPRLVPLAASLVVASLGLAGCSTDGCEQTSECGPTQLCRTGKCVERTAPPPPVPTGDAGFRDAGVADAVGADVLATDAASADAAIADALTGDASTGDGSVGADAAPGGTDGAVGGDAGADAGVPLVPRGRVTIAEVRTATSQLPAIRIQGAFVEEVAPVVTAYTVNGVACSLEVRAPGTWVRVPSNAFELSGLWSSVLVAQPVRAPEVRVGAVDTGNIPAPFLFRDEARMLDLAFGVGPAAPMGGVASLAGTIAQPPVNVVSATVPSGGLVLGSGFLNFGYQASGAVPASSLVLELSDDAGRAWLRCTLRDLGFVDLSGSPPPIRDFIGAVGSPNVRMSLGIHSVREFQVPRVGGGVMPTQVRVVRSVAIPVRL
jgi:hypothetical protein